LKYVVIWVRAYSDEGESKWNQASIRLNMVETGRGGYEGVVEKGENGGTTSYFYTIIIAGILIVVAVILAFIYKMRTKGKKRMIALILFFVAGSFILLMFISLNAGFQCPIEGYVLNGFGLLFIGLGLGILNYGENTLFSTVGFLMSAIVGVSLLSILLH